MLTPTVDIEVELRRFRTGRLHMTHDLWGSRSRRCGRRHRTGHVTPYRGTYYYAFNLTHEPWRSSPELRHALSLAIDRDMLARTVTRSYELPAYTFVPPGTFGFPAWNRRPPG